MWIVLNWKGLGLGGLGRRRAFLLVVFGGSIVCKYSKRVSGVGVVVLCMYWVEVRRSGE